jgi:DNA modification methylase
MPEKAKEYNPVQKVLAGKFKLQERLSLGKIATFLPNKGLPVYNWFYYKEGFSRDLVMQLLRMFSPGREDWVLDPFCGVGTTQLACLESGVNSVGFDVNPVSVFSSRAKIQEYDVGRVGDAVSGILAAKYKRPRVSVRHPMIKRAFPPKLLERVIFYRDRILGIRDTVVRDLLMLALMNVSVKSSYLWKDGSVLKIRKKPVPPLKDMLRRQLRRMIRDLEGFKRSRAKAKAEFGDARSIRLEDGSVNAVITSPPYLNKIEYTRIYEIENELFLRQVLPEAPVRTFLGLTLDKLERDSLLLARSLDTDTVNQLPQEACPYLMDMEQSIREMFRVCKPGARVGLLVGNGCFPDRVVDSDVLLCRLAEGVGFDVERILVLNKRWCTKKRTEKVGIARESLLLWRKP